jgi:hypothetical protein
VAEILGEAPEALSNDEIIRRYNSSLTELVKASTDPTYSFERTVSIANAKYQFMLIRGFQNNMLGFGGSNDYAGGGQPDWVPFDYGAGQEETGADIRLNPVINFIGGDAWKFCAVMGSSSPRVKGVADDLRNQEDIDAANCADVNIRDLWTKLKIDRKWKVPAFHIYATGPCFARTYWNTDPIKYGTTSEPEIDIVIGEDGLPAPKIVGENTYANGDAELSFHSVMEVSIPWEARELRGNFLRLERMMNRYALLAKYPGKNGQPGPLDEYRDGEVPDDQLTGDSVTAAEAREATTNPSGTAKPKKQDQWRFVEWWIPPHLFEAILNVQAREIIKTQFSRGFYMARVGNVTVEIDEREVTEEWAVCQVSHEDRICERPICADNVPMQRVINDLAGMAVETVLRAITQTIIDNQLIDRQAMSVREAVPSELILTAMPVDGDLQKRIFQIPPARLSDQVLPLLNLVRSWGQDITGIRPELSGGGQPTSTYREAKQRRDQALQQLAPQAQAMRECAEDIARNLVRLRSKYGSGTVKATQKTAYGLETSVADMADLQDSGWHTESDDSFPLTLSDRRDAVFSLLKDGLPEPVLLATGVLDPMNVSETLEVLGIPGYESPVADQRSKTLWVIDQLLQGQPVPIPAPPPQPGQPPQPRQLQPSIHPDMFDDHALVDKLVASWLIGPVGRKHMGTPGYENVCMYWNNVHQLAMPPAPPPPPPMKGSMAVSLKAEDVPNQIERLLEAAGVPASTAPKPPMLTAPVGAPVGPMGSPSPLNAGPPPQPSKPGPMNGIPPLPNGVASPSPSPV